MKECDNEIFSEKIEKKFKIVGIDEYKLNIYINDLLKSGGTFKQFPRVDKDLMTYILKGRKKLLRPGLLLKQGKL